jgi:alkyl hydroperoxide reductase subunit AhpC
MPGGLTLAPGTPYFTSDGPGPGHDVSKEGYMGLRINDVVPDFTARTNRGEIRFHDWIGDSWAILFSHPKDFTPVCTTEFGAVAQLSDEWTKRKTKVIGVSVDGVDEHKRWIGDIETVAGAEVGFPIIADEGL